MPGLYRLPSRLRRAAGLARRAGGSRVGEGVFADLAAAAAAAAVSTDPPFDSAGGAASDDNEPPGGGAVKEPAWGAAGAPGHRGAFGAASSELGAQAGGLGAEAAAAEGLR